VAGIDVYEAHNGTSAASNDSVSAAVSASGASVPRAFSFSTAVNIFRVITPGAYGVLDIENGAVSTYVKKLGSAGWRDLVNQRAGVGVKIFYGVKDLDMANRCLAIYSGQTGLF